MTDGAADGYHDFDVLTDAERGEVERLRPLLPDLPADDHARLNVLLGKATRDPAARAYAARHATRRVERDYRRQQQRQAERPTGA